MMKQMKYVNEWNMLTTSLYFLFDGSKAGLRMEMSGGSSPTHAFPIFFPWGSRGVGHGRLDCESQEKQAIGWMGALTSLYRPAMLGTGAEMPCCP